MLESKFNPSPNPHIVVSITEGRTVRDLFYNGLLDYFQAAGYDVTIFTEATRVTEFTDLWRRPGIDFHTLYPYDSTSWSKRAFYIRRKLARNWRGLPLKAWLQFESKFWHLPRSEYIDFFRRRRTALCLVTHPHLVRETELISSAHNMGVPTLGIVRSWDNVYKGIRSRPQVLAVWNKVNQQEVIEFEGYALDKIKIIGSPQFDPYFVKDNLWSREKFAAHFELDPDRPIILFATLGYFIPGNDETYWMDVLLQKLDANQIVGNPQIICRLHPWSRYEHFEKYAAHPSVRLSYVTRYWPALTWYMTHNDVVEMANMLHHSAAVITPGSTVTLEAAIFDRPTIVPIFHNYQPERMSHYFSYAVIGRHFGRLMHENLVPIVKDVGEFHDTINCALRDSSWYREQRQKLVNDYVHYTDGKSTQRLAQLAIEIADTK